MVWKKIWENEKYLISECGKVKNKLTGHLLKGRMKRTGYLYVKLCTKINRKEHLVHRLVAKAFVEGYKEDLVVNHKDGNKLNSHKDNLECITQSKNIKHYYNMKKAI